MTSLLFYVNIESLNQPMIIFVLDGNWFMIYNGTDVIKMEIIGNPYIGVFCIK